MRIKELFFEAGDDPLGFSLGDLTGWNKYQRTDQPTADDNWDPDRKLPTDKSSKVQSTRKKTAEPSVQSEIPRTSDQRIVMNKIINDQLLMSDDRKFIQSVINNIQSGAIKPNVNANSLIEILKLKNSGYTLDKKQIEIISKYNSSL